MEGVAKRKVFLGQNKASHLSLSVKPNLPSYSCGKCTISLSDYYCLYYYFALHLTSPGFGGKFCVINPSKLSSIPSFCISGFYVGLALW